MGIILDTLKIRKRKVYQSDVGHGHGDTITNKTLTMTNAELLGRFEAHQTQKLLYTVISVQPLLIRSLYLGTKNNLPFSTLGHFLHSKCNTKRLIYEKHDK